MDPAARVEMKNRWENLIGKAPLQGNFKSGSCNPYAISIYAPGRRSRPGKSGDAESILENRGGGMGRKRDFHGFREVQGLARAWSRLGIARIQLSQSPRARQAWHGKCHIGSGFGVLVDEKQS